LRFFAALLLFLAANAGAATAYVTDELVLGVYPDEKAQGARLATLHSGAVVETLGSRGEATEVRLADGTTGWVKTTYLTNNEPAVVRIKQLQDELDRGRATTPELAEAAERSEVERLTRELREQKAASISRAGSLPADAQSPPRAEEPDARVHAWVWPASIVCALACGTWIGYATLARRIRVKFGGLKVY
jgi:hypothetical protein